MLLKGDLRLLFTAVADNIKVIFDIKNDRRIEFRGIHNYVF